MAGSRTGWRRGGDAGRWLRKPPARAVTPAENPLPDPEDLRRNALSEKAADFDAVRAAVDDAGGFVRGLWVTFVTLGTYLVIAAGSVTHRQLFLENPIKLPLLDVELPLVAFFVIAPWFFVVFHFYLLLQLALLSEKIARYNKLLGEAFPGDAAKDEAAGNLRRQLPNDILVQFLAGPRGKGEGAVRPLLMLAAWATIVIGPLVVLIALQYRFLPYQEQWVTWVHRGAVIVDLALLWFLWPGVVWGRGEWRLSLEMAAGLLASLAVLAASGFALTFPREWMDGTPLAQAFHDAMTWPLPQRPGDIPNSLCGGEGSNEPAVAKADPSSLRARFRAWVQWPAADTRADRDWLECVPEARRVIPGTLRLANESFVDEDKLKAMEERGDKSGLKPWVGARTLRTGPRNLVAADLRFVNLSRADLRGVTLDDASLEGAQLAAARLDGAETNLIRTSLIQAHLQGASLVNAELQGAWMLKTKLQGASLIDAGLQDAELKYAQLQGASLSEAQLQGASLRGAQLQGASLDHAQLQGASLGGAFVFRASGAQAPVGPVLAERKFSSPYSGKEEDLTDKIIDQWNAETTRYVVDADHKLAIGERFERLKGADNAEDAAFLRLLNDQSFAPEVFAQEIDKLACEPESAPYVARGLMHNGILEATNDGSKAIAKHMRSGREKIENCPGVRGFTDQDWADLDRLEARATPPAPSPNPSP